MDTRFIPVPDCGIAAHAFLSRMEKHVTPEDRLDILRAADSRRKWASLDDRRICTCCNKFITGRQIEIVRDQRGRFLLRCPTPGCTATVEDWFYQRNGAVIEADSAAGRQVSFLFS